MEKANLWAAMQRLNQYVYIVEHLDASLTARIAEIQISDPEAAKALQQDVLFYLRQKHQDLLTQLAVSIQSYLAIDIIIKNNLELIKGVDRATHHDHLRAPHRGRRRAGAGNQRLVLDQVAALNTTTSGMIESTSKMLPRRTPRRSRSRLRRRPSASTSSRPRSPTSTRRWTPSTSSRRRSTPWPTRSASSRTRSRSPRRTSPACRRRTSDGRRAARPRQHRRLRPRGSHDVGFWDWLTGRSRRKEADPVTVRPAPDRGRHPGLAGRVEAMLADGHRAVGGALARRAHRPHHPPDAAEAAAAGLGECRRVRRVATPPTTSPRLSVATSASPRLGQQPADRGRQDRADGPGRPAGAARLDHDKMLDAANRADAEALIAHGRFLEAKFGHRPRAASLNASGVLA